MFEILDTTSQSAVIKVIGVGGGGGNAVKHMANCGIEGVDFICANTDSQALRGSNVRTALQIGCNITKGLGAGADPDVGRQAAMEDRDRIVEVIDGADMLFITAGLGGGTGTGAAPKIAEIARALGALTIGVVTKPFPFEGKRRMTIAEEGIQTLKEHVDTLITIPNERLLQIADKKMSLGDAFRLADDVLRQGIQGISDLITVPGLINVDFADVKTIMSNAGSALMAIGRGSGENRAADAARAAIASPLLDINIDGARGILFNVTGGPSLTLHEVSEAAELVAQAADPDANIIFGAVIDPRFEDEVQVTVIATGFDMRPQARPVRPISPVRPPSTPQPQPQPAAPRESPRLSEDDTDVPAFLRRR